MDNRDITKRFDLLKSERSIVQHKWDEIERYVTPYRGRFFKEQPSEGAIEWNRNGYDFDSTAPMYHQSLASSLHDSLTSPATQWFAMRFRDEVLNKHTAAATWLQHASERVHYELQDSNFNLEINETYQDLVGFGTGCITLEEAPGGAGWHGLNFASVPLKEVFFEVDWRGNVLRFYREIQWTPQQIISKFGDDVPQKIKDLEEGGQVEKQTVLFVIAPRNGRIVPVGGKLSPSKRPWEWKFILKDSNDTLGKPGGDYEMSAFVPRWRTTSESMGATPRR